MTNLNKIISLLIGYFLGSWNPAQYLSHKKGVNLREEGTGNLGTTNTLLTMGFKSALLVLLLDMGKAILSAKIAKWLFPKLAVAGMLAALGAILGHIFPWQMGFRGGKGLAAFGGMILEYNPMVFCVLLLIGLVVAYVVNYGVGLPVAASILFPVAAALVSRDLSVFLVSLAASAVILLAHMGNVKKAIRGKDIRVRDFLHSKFSH